MTPPSSSNPPWDLLLYQMQTLQHDLAAFRQDWKESSAAHDIRIRSLELWRERREGVQIDDRLRTLEAQESKPSLDMTRVTLAAFGIASTALALIGTMLKVTGKI